MFPAPFEYHKANSVDEALKLLDRHGDQEVELLAGGHSLLPTMKSGLAAPDVLIDISQIEDLQTIESDGDTTRIGALTRYADVDASEACWQDITVVAEAAHHIGDVQVRNRGTVGGNLAHADPASDLPAAVLAADARITVQGPDGERHIDVDDFFHGMYATDVGEDELLTAIEVPHQEPGTVSAYVKKPSPSSGYAMVGVAAKVRTTDGAVRSARVAANGAMDHAVRLDPVEEALAGEPFDADAIENAAALATDDIEDWALMDDIQASAEFRAQLLRVYTRRALEAAMDRAEAPAPTAAD